MLYIKDEKGELVKGRVHTYKSEKDNLIKSIKKIKTSQYIVGEKKKFNCSNFNYSEYEECY